MHWKYILIFKNYIFVKQSQLFSKNKREKIKNVRKRTLVCSFALADNFMKSKKSRLEK